MPRIMAASRSIWLVPMQNAPITMSRGAAATTSAVRRVRERIPTKWTSATAAFRSSPVSAFLWRWIVV
jgi:hypothetical protein